MKAVERAIPRRRPLTRLAEQKEGDRPDDDGTRSVPADARLRHLADEAVRGEVEVGLRPDLRNEVVVVRVEPLRHLRRSDVTGAAGDREIAREIESAVVGDQRSEPGGNGADGDRGIQHLVVVGERFGDRRVLRPEPERDEPLTGHPAKLRRRGFELIDGDGSGPEGLDRLLEFASTTNARVSEDATGGEGWGAHAGSLFW